MQQQAVVAVARCGTGQPSCRGGVLANLEECLGGCWGSVRVDDGLTLARMAVRLSFCSPLTSFRTIPFIPAALSSLKGTPSEVIRAI